MTDRADPRAVADDPSGIVQQMPEIRFRAEGRCSTDSTMRHFAYAVMVPDPDGDYVEYEKARAAEADLRAEVERLRAALDPNQTKTSYMGEIKMTVHDVCEDEDGNLVDHPREVTVDWTTIKAVMAMIRARAALSPETDGGQDG